MYGHVHDPCVQCAVQLRGRYTLPMTLFETVYLTVDASTHAETAARYAALLGGRLGLPLHALHVVDSRLFSGTGLVGAGVGDLVSSPGMQFDGELQEALEARGRTLLAQVQALAEGEGVREIHTELRTGLPAAELSERAGASDLVVLGRQGDGAQQNRSSRLGSVVERVIRHAQGAVLVTPAEFLEPQRLLLAYDGSDEAIGALPYAVAFAERLGLPLLAVSVDDDEAVAEAHLGAVRDFISQHAQGLSLDTSLNPNTEVLRGEPTEAILAAVRSGDVLAIGAFGEGRLTEFFRGSTTEALLRAAEVPVLLHS